MYWLSNTIGEERKITKREGRNGGGREGRKDKDIYNQIWACSICSLLWCTGSQALNVITLVLLSSSRILNCLSLFQGLLKIGLRTTFSHIATELQKFVDITNI